MSFFSVVGMLLAFYIDSHVNFLSAKYLWFDSSCKIPSFVYRDDDDDDDDDK